MSIPLSPSHGCRPERAIARSLNEPAAELGEALGSPEILAGVVTTGSHCCSGEDAGVPKGLSVFNH